MHLAAALQKARNTQVLTRYSAILSKNSPCPIRLHHTASGAPFRLSFGSPVFASVLVYSFGDHLELKWRSVLHPSLWPVTPITLTAWLTPQLMRELPPTIHAQAELLKSL